MPPDCYLEKDYAKPKYERYRRINKTSKNFERLAYALRD
jgi:hypothetical protein